MATIEVDEAVKRSVSFAARMADVTEGEIVRRLIAGSSHEATGRDPRQAGVPVYADYEGHRTRALYFAPARVEIIDGPLEGKSFKTPTGAARAVVRHYNPSVNDNRNGWEFWQIDNGGGPRAWLQSIRPLRPSTLSVRRLHRARSVPVWQTNPRRKTGITPARCSPAPVSCLSRRHPTSLDFARTPLWSQ